MVENPSAGDVDRFITDSLPSTFGDLVHAAMRDGKDWYRPIDRRLQALRKAGAIYHRREGRSFIWELAARQKGGDA